MGACDKGKRGERLACEVLSGAIPGLQRTFGQSRGGHEAADIDAPGCGWRIEVKHHKRRPNAGAAYDQALEDARDAGDDRPILVATKSDRAPWLVTIEAAEFVRLVQAAQAHAGVYATEDSYKTIADDGGE